MTEDELKALSIKELKGYLRVYGIPANNLLEKSEFVRLITRYNLSQQNVDNYGANVLPLIKADYQSTPNPNTQNTTENNPLNFMKEVLDDLKEPFTHNERAPTSNTSNPDLNPLNFIKKVFDGPKEATNRRSSNPFSEIIDGISNIFKPPEKDDQAPRPNEGNSQNNQDRQNERNSTAQNSQSGVNSTQNNSDRQKESDSTFRNNPERQNERNSTLQQQKNNVNISNSSIHNQRNSQTDFQSNANNERQEDREMFTSSRHDSFKSSLNSRRESFHRPDIELTPNELPHHEHSFSTPNRPFLSQNIDIPKPRSRSTDNAPTFEFSPRQSAPYSSSYSPSTGTPTRISETPTIRQIIANKINLDDLSTKALRQILLLERVSLKFALERKDLLERVQLLIDNVRKEQGNLPEDQICKVSIN
ncbi:hypothetical protein HDV04_002916 [Boothiomyces sp. JEL0838]|nr:hypothetical protein HDV04_002916 [Boothiomyces sp. JEL0838]